MLQNVPHGIASTPEHDMNTFLRLYIGCNFLQRKTPEGGFGLVTVRPIQFHTSYWLKDLQNRCLGHCRLSWEVWGVAPSCWGTIVEPCGYLFAGWPSDAQHFIMSWMAFLGVSLLIFWFPLFLFVLNTNGMFLRNLNPCDFYIKKIQNINLTLYFRSVHSG